jgi:5-methylcytosine-specific restriction endonuclease McrA
MTRWDKLGVPTDIEGTPLWVMRERAMEWQHGLCCYCGGKLSDIGSTLEHIVPSSKGGTDCKHNFAASCPRCNNERGTEPHELFRNKKLSQISKARTGGEV